MEYLSPLLQNKIKTTKKPMTQKNEHDVIYERLAKRANTVKPNEAKAKLIDQGLLASAFSAVADTGVDCVNFVKATATGKIGDNSLGRINDVGMKAGALLIASFLATHAKTKTDAIMQFLGATTFFASMSLWPKIFINLPARIIHGFDIGKRYISAQGEKKDFFLDNQFLPWDAYSKEDFERIGRRTGIDYNSENGEEKIKRKMQKTALQNRTLWMGTAGFATPLMTAMIGNAIEPRVKDAVIKHGYDNAKEIISSNTNLVDYLDKSMYKKSKADLSSEAQKLKSWSASLDELFNAYSEKPLDSKFYKKLSSLFQPSSLYKQFKDLDDKTPINKSLCPNLSLPLMKIRELTSEIDEASLRENLKSLTAVPRIAIKTSEDGIPVRELLNPEKINRIVEEIKQKGMSISAAKEVLQEHNISQDSVSGIINNLKVNNSRFKEVMKEYYETSILPLKGRIKAYLSLVNPVAGSKAESVYTREYLSTMDNLFKQFGFDYETLRQIKEDGIKTTQDVAQKTMEGAKAKELLIQKFQEFTQKTKDLPEQEYIQELKKFAQPLSDDVKEVVQHLINDANLDKIRVQRDFGNPQLTQALNEITDTVLKGTDSNPKGIFNIIKRFIRNKNIDLESIKAKPFICANFERSILNSSFEKALVQNHLMTAGNKEQLQSWIDIARAIIYDGTVSKDACRADIMQSILDKKTNSSMPEIFNTLKGIIFNPQSFNAEEQAMSGIKGVVQNLNELGYQAVKGLEMNSHERVFRSKEYLEAGSFAQHVKNHASRLFNNKTWMKRFGTMSLVLVAITLLVQPLFGNIKKEYPKSKEGGAK